MAFFGLKTYFKKFFWGYFYPPTLPKQKNRAKRAFKWVFIGAGIKSPPPSWCPFQRPHLVGLSSFSYVKPCLDFLLSFNVIMDSIFFFLAMWEWPTGRVNERKKICCCILLPLTLISSTIFLFGSRFAIAVLLTTIHWQISYNWLH